MSWRCAQTPKPCSQMTMCMFQRRARWNMWKEASQCTCAKGFISHCMHHGTDPLNTLSHSRKRQSFHVFPEMTKFVMTVNVFCPSQFSGFYGNHKRLNALSPLRKTSLRPVVSQLPCRLRPLLPSLTLWTERASNPQTNTNRFQHLLSSLRCTLFNKCVYHGQN